MLLLKNKVANSQTGYKSSDIAKAKLVAAASDLMKENDSTNITLSEVAKRSGLNSGLVKYHFGNKEGLLLAVLERDMTSGFQSLQFLLSIKTLAPDQKLRVHLEALVTTFYNVPYLKKLVQLLTRDASESQLKRVTLEFIKPVADAHAVILKDGYEQGYFRKVDPMSFYFCALGAAESMYSQRYVLKALFQLNEMDEITHKENVSEVVEILMNGVLVR